MSCMASQPVGGRLTRSAIFLVATLKDVPDASRTVLKLCGDLSGLGRGVGFRTGTGELSCVMGIGSRAWDRLFSGKRPKGLHPFKEILGVHHAPATPGDLLFHIRANGMDLCFELASQIMSRLEDVVAVADSVQGFKYIDERDL